MYRSQDLLRAPGQSHASDCLCDGHGRMPVKTASNERSTNNAPDGCYYLYFIRSSLRCTSSSS